MQWKAEYVAIDKETGQSVNNINHTFYAETASVARIIANGYKGRYERNNNKQTLFLTRINAV